MKKLRIFITTLAAIVATTLATAQGDPIAQARLFTEQKDYAKAIEAYKKLYDENPVSVDVYGEYLNVLLLSKDYKNAEKLVAEQKAMRKHHPLAYIDMGKVYLASGKEKKAVEQFEESLKFINGDDMLTQQIANAFNAIKRDDFALKTYERARDILKHPYLYSGPMSRLYAKTGDIDKAVSTLLEAGPGQTSMLEDTKATLLEFFDNDPRKLQQGQKAIVKKIQEQPENPYFGELLTWLYTQKDDWEGAMMQIEAIDERNKEHGERLLEFARYAGKESKFSEAIKAYDAIINKGKELPYYSIAKNEKLNIQFRALQQDHAYKKEDVALLQKAYQDFFAEFPQYYTSETVRDYAKLEARFANAPQRAIELLQHSLKQPGVRKDIAGRIKLDLGDYQILMGKVWEATLSYGQVDKDFREDMLGEEARFRNAKLAYYRGDFNWAEGQLSVLKASTSELIANDALYLSILILENITPDSNYLPLRRFAYADLLTFQNKDTAAEALLDSVVNAFPEHPLKDDILMQKAELAKKHRDYKKSLSHLKEIQEKHGEDVLGDDAVFKTADLYEHYLHQPEDAKKFYEHLIIAYPGSTYVQVARNRLSELQSGAPALP
jgi:tetratricopeptide (TPR) repeat protein